jgi:predicted TIM-barrel fold metal-dependent hydrolase
MARDHRQGVGDVHVIDADAHVEESVATWQHLYPALHARRPIPVTLPPDTSFGDFNAVWIVDNKLRQSAANPTSMRVASKKGVSIGAQELTDVAARLADLDRFGIAEQVIYPSAWIGCLADDPELEAALAASYNRFLAEQCDQAAGRLSYAAVVPYRRPRAAVEELRWVREQGRAVSVFTRGMEWDMPLSHPSFYPIYAEAERQNLAIAVHVGFGSPAISRLFDGLPRYSPHELPFIPPRGRGLVSGLLVQFGFSAIMEAGLPDEFPGLRWVFLEIGAAWLVGALGRLSGPARAVAHRCLDDGRLFVSGEPDEDLAYLVQRLGEDCLVGASDYPHADDFRHDPIYDSFLREAGLSERLVEKLLGDNPRRLYEL